MTMLPDTDKGRPEPRGMTAERIAELRALCDRLQTAEGEDRIRIKYAIGDECDRDTPALLATIADLRALAAELERIVVDAVAGEVGLAELAYAEGAKNDETYHRHAASSLRSVLPFMRAHIAALPDERSAG